jgi:hypothetical protein
LSIFDIADDIGLDLSSLHKEGLLMYALWVTLLTVLKKHTPVTELKYTTLQAFHEAYNNLFAYEDDEEQHRLWSTANWMSVLFTLIMARKNKGLAMQVVPKLVEGWHAKYVTGSGQTRLTANRVHIFETEGNTKANHRGKIKPKKKALPRRTPRTKQPIERKKRKVEKMEDAGHTDDEDSSVNEDVAKAYSTWREQPRVADNNDLLRTSSLFDLTSTDLSPSELQRGVSWTEIPIMVSSPYQPPTQPSQLLSQPVLSQASQTSNVPSLSAPVRYKCFSPTEDMSPPKEDLDKATMRDIFSGYPGLQTIF